MGNSQEKYQPQLVDIFDDLGYASVSRDIFWGAWSLAWNRYVRVNIVFFLFLLGKLKKSEIEYGNPSHCSTFKMNSDYQILVFLTPNTNYKLIRKSNMISLDMATLNTVVHSK